MAWYRAGGSGIPASVKTNMNNVLNKKMGTSGQVYPPTEWADDVNLMGMLEVKTASGAIASFSDGADDVPIKSLVCNIDANLSGVSSVGVVHSGENLFDVSTVIAGNLNVNTGNVDTSQSASWRASDFIQAKEGDYTLSWKSPQSSYYQGKWVAYDANQQYIDGASMTAYTTYSKTFTAPTGTKYLRIGWAITASGNPAPKDNIRLNAGTSDLGYTNYKTPETKTANLGRTIYGGSVDVVNGTGTKTHVRIDMGSLSWTYHAASGVYSDYFDCYLPNDSILGIAAVAFDGVTDDYVSIPSNNIAKGTYTNGVMALANASRRFIICDTRYTSEAALTTALQGKYLSYPLETHEDFTFTPTPINSYLGDNNIWCDSGDSEIVYRSSGTATIITPTLISKTITENGTYSAEDDNADGYDEVTVNVAGDSGDYLYNVNTVQINTGYTHNANTKLVLTCTPIYNSSYGVLLGARKNNYSNNALVFFATFNGRRYCYTRTGQEKQGDLYDASSGTMKPWYDEKVVVTIEGKVCTVYNPATEESITISADSSTANEGIAPLGLFCQNNTTTAGGWSGYDPGWMKFYNLKIYESDVLLHDFIPAYNNSQYCIYDTVAQEYIYATSGAANLRGRIAQS